MNIVTHTRIVLTEASVSQRCIHCSASGLPQQISSDACHVSGSREGSTRAKGIDCVVGKGLTLDAHGVSSPLTNLKGDDFQRNFKTVI